LTATIVGDSARIKAIEDNSTPATYIDPAKLNCSLTDHSLSNETNPPCIIEIDEDAAQILEDRTIDLKSSDTDSIVNTSQNIVNDGIKILHLDYLPPSQSSSEDTSAAETEACSAAESTDDAVESDETDDDLSPRCNTCDFDKAPIICIRCRFSFCTSCANLPLEASVKTWSCFLCHLEATRLVKEARIEKLRRGARDVESETGEVAETAIGQSEPFPYDEEPALNGSASYLQFSPTLQAVVTASTRPHSPNQTCQQTPDSLPKGFEYVASVSDKTLQIQFRQSKTVGNTNSDRRVGVLDADVEALNFDSGAEEPLVLEDETDDDSDGAMDIAEEDLTPCDQDSDTILKQKLSSALKEIRRLKQTGVYKDRAIRHLQNNLTIFRTRLCNAEAALDSRNVRYRKPTIPFENVDPPRLQLVQVAWTDEEVKVLRTAIQDCGAGQWKAIHEKYKDQFHPTRTRYNLRDKYRQLKSKKMW